MNTDYKAAIEALVACYQVIAPEKMKYFDIGPYESDTMRVYFAAFLCYLAKVDGEVSWDECEVIEYYTDLSLSPDEVEILYKTMKIDEGEYATSIPEPLVVLVEKDNELYRLDMIDGITASELYVQVHYLLAQELIHADGVIENIEASSALKYLNILEDYLNNNALARKSE